MVREALHDCVCGPLRVPVRLRSKPGRYRCGRRRCSQWRRSEDLMCCRRGPICRLSLPESPSFSIRLLLYQRRRRTACPGLNIPSADNRNQFVTASYVLQARAGRSRPFFQIGAGAFTAASTQPPGMWKGHPSFTDILWNRIQAWLSLLEAARRSI